MESLAVQYCERYRKFLVALLGWGSEHGLAAAHGMFKLDRLPDEQLGVLAADVYDELGRRTSSDGRPAHAAPTFPTTAPVGSPEFTQQTLRNQSKMKLASLSPKRMTELVSDLVHEFEARYPHVLGGRGGARPPGQSIATTTTTTTTTHAAGLPTPPSVLGPQPSPRQPVPQQSSSSSSTMSPQHQPGLATPYLRYDVKTAMALNSASIASPPLLPTSPYQHSHYPGPVAGLSSPGVRPVISGPMPYSSAALSSGPVPQRPMHSTGQSTVSSAVTLQQQQQQQQQQHQQTANTQAVAPASISAAFGDTNQHKAVNGNAAGTATASLHSGNNAASSSTVGSSTAASVTGMPAAITGTPTVATKSEALAPTGSETHAASLPVGSNAAGAAISRSDTPSSPASSMAAIHSTGGPINGQQASTPVSLPPPPSTMFSQSSASNTHSSAHSQSSSLLTRNPSTPATAALTGRILPPAPPRPSIPPPPSSSYPHTLQRPTANPLSPNNNPQQQQQQQQQHQLPTSPHVAALSPTMPFQVRPPPPLSPTDSVVWSSPGGAIGAISSPASHPQQPPTTTLVNANEHARAPNIANLFGKGHPQHHQRQHQNPQTAQSQQSQQPSAAAVAAGVHSGNPPVPLSNPYSYHPTSYGTFPYHSTAPSGMPVRPLPPAAVTAPAVGAVTTGHPRAPPTATTVTSNAQTSSAESNSALDELKKEYNQQISDLQTQLEAVNSRLIEEIGRADNAETLLSDVVTKSKEDADETSSIFSDSSSRRDTVPPEILDLRRINAQQQQRLERSQREIAELNTVLSSTRQRLQDTIAKTAEARAEADRLRQQIAELQRENEQLLDDDERHTEKYKKFVEEIRVLEQDLEKARRDARKYRTISVYGKEHSYGDILHLKGLISVDGVLDARFLQSFQHTVDQLLIEARSSDPESIGELAHSVSLIVQNIIDSIESFGNSNLDGINTLIVSAQQLRTTRGRLSAASAELVRAAARYAQGFGISPVSLLEGAASQLATEVLESAKLLKVKPSLQAARAVGSGLVSSRTNSPRLGALPSPRVEPFVGRPQSPRIGAISPKLGARKPRKSGSGGGGGGGGAGDGFDSDSRPKSTGSGGSGRTPKLGPNLTGSSGSLNDPNHHLFAAGSNVSNVRTGDKQTREKRRDFKISPSGATAATAAAGSSSSSAVPAPISTSNVPESEEVGFEYRSTGMTPTTSTSSTWSDANPSSSATTTATATTAAATGTHHHQHHHHQHHHQQVEEDNDNRSPPGVSASVSHPSAGAAPSGPDSLPDLAEFVKARSADVAVNIQTLIAVTRNNNINPVDLHQSLQQLSDGLGKVVNASRNVLLPLAHASANGSPASNILAQFSGFSVDVAQKSLEGISESYVQLGNIMNELQNTALGILGANEVEEKRLLSKLFSSGNSASSKTTGGRKRAATALRNHRTFAAPAVQDLVNNKNYKRKLTATILEVAKSLGALFQQLETTTSSAPAQTV